MPGNHVCPGHPGLMGSWSCVLGTTAWILYIATVTVEMWRRRDSWPGERVNHAMAPRRSSVHAMLYNTMPPLIITERGMAGCKAKELGPRTGQLTMNESRCTLPR